MEADNTQQRTWAAPQQPQASVNNYYGGWGWNGVSPGGKKAFAIIMAVLFIGVCVFLWWYIDNEKKIKESGYLSGTYHFSSGEQLDVTYTFTKTGFTARYKVYGIVADSWQGTYSNLVYSNSFTLHLIDSNGIAIGTKHLEFNSDRTAFNVDYGSVYLTLTKIS